MTDIAVRSGDLPQMPQVQEESCWRGFISKVTAYAPHMFTMLSVAALVYKIWGGIVLLSVMGAAAVTYALFHRQIDWFVSSNEWLPAVTRAALSPVLVLCGGWLGAAVSWIVGGATAIAEQWQQREQRAFIQSTSQALGRETNFLGRQVGDFSRQTDQGQAIVRRIFEICPELQQRFAHVDASALTIDQQRERIVEQSNLLNEVMREFIEHHQAMMSDPNIAARVQVISDLENQAAEALALLRARNQALAQSLEEDASHAVRQGEMEQVLSNQIAQLQEILNAIQRRFQ